MAELKWAEMEARWRKEMTKIMADERIADFAAIVMALRADPGKLKHCRKAVESNMFLEAKEDAPRDVATQSAELD